MKKLINYVLKLIILCGIVGFSYAESVYDAARKADMKTLRTARFEGNDLFIPDENGFIPYELVALNIDVHNKANLQKHVELMFWLKQYKPEKHVFGKASISLVQEGLLSLGYDAGSVDGIIGKKTTIAIKQYQQDNNLPETGKMGPVWLGQLYQSLVKEVQNKLKAQGYKIRKADGFIGKNTLIAMTEYRTKKDLPNPSYHGLDAKLIKSLAEESKSPVKSTTKNSTKHNAKNETSNKQVTKGQKTVNNSKSTAIQSSAEQDAARYLQAGLKMLGYKITVDGAAGKSTTAKLKSYQEKNKLPQTGVLDDNTKPQFDKNVTQAVQKKLTKLGFNTKGSDGKIGNNTKVAINNYNKNIGSDAPDVIDADLLVSLSGANSKSVATNSKNSNTKGKSSKHKYGHYTLTTEQIDTLKKSSNVNVSASLPKTDKSIKSLVSASEIKGSMLFSRNNNMITKCSISGKQIPIEWCEPFYPLPPTNHCEATFKPNGEVINLWCK